VKRLIFVAASLREIHNCEVCGQTHISSILDLGRHPMCDDLVPIGDHRISREYPIEILYCGSCGTAHQRFQIPKDKLFPSTYHYRSRHTADVLNGMRQLAVSTAGRVGGLAAKTVMDVGCNDGSLLSIFRELGAGKTIGIEPTGAAADASAQGHSITREFLSEPVAERIVAAHGNPDIVTFTNVFAHIEDLQQVIRAVKVLSGPQTVLVIENHYLGAILEKDQFDTFYHEHPRTYSYLSFCRIADSLGMRILAVEFPKRYGGNIRVMMETRVSAEPHDRFGEVAAMEGPYGERLSNLSARVERWRSRKSELLRAQARRHGPLLGKAFPGRAAIPIKLLGLDTSTIRCVFEKPLSAKIGHYVPGTRIPIVSDETFTPSSPAAPLVNFAWHIGEEIRGYMRGRGYSGPIIDIINSDDFGTAT
jgi:hypothetical protein